MVLEPGWYIVPPGGSNGAPFAGEGAAGGEGSVEKTP